MTPQPQVRLAGVAAGGISSSYVNYEFPQTIWFDCFIYVTEDKKIQVIDTLANVLASRPIPARDAT